MENVVFIRPTKIAGTSITDVLGLQLMTTPEQIETEFQQTGWVNFAHIDYSLLLSGGYISKKFNDTAFKFTFVRNPYDRAVSLFFHERKWRRTWIWPFTVFCKKLEAGFDPIGLYSNLRNSIWNPQWEWLKNVWGMLDFVGRYETLEADFSLLCGVLGIKAPPLKRRSWIRHEPYQKYYCEESAAIVRKIYRDDFVNLSYSEEIV